MSITFVELKKYQCDLCGAISEMEAPKHSNPLRDRPDGWASFPPGLAGQKHVCNVCAAAIYRAVRCGLLDQTVCAANEQQQS